ncbi:hypothetical protein DM02DRAFT_680465 [Periconia macrospinosa]|uniref:RING-type domain-containing protein n=1 Tax=Periconia macrospinosa TaxID=97972 RepID=A0A2V1DP40_9PLEO|nr:hypothetical protein DM02DRAFT_680465 [Periconia macrospinosa]
MSSLFGPFNMPPATDSNPPNNTSPVTDSNPPNNTSPASDSNPPNNTSPATDSNPPNNMSPATNNRSGTPPPPTCPICEGPLKRPIPITTTMYGQHDRQIGEQESQGRGHSLPGPPPEGFTNIVSLYRKLRPKIKNTYFRLKDKLKRLLTREDTQLLPAPEHPIEIKRCSHVIGHRCLQSWLRTQVTCPVCYNPIHDDEFEPTEEP